MPKPQVNQYERAFRTWPILVALAHDGKPITYGSLGKLIGVHQKPVRFVLAKIQTHCKDAGLPPLTILVQDQKGAVGAGFIEWEHDNLDEGRRLVYAYPWSAISNPFAFAEDGTTPAAIAKGLVERSQLANEKFARLRVRGIAQAIFREAMLKVYGGHCAISGDGGIPLLQAAHIIPWSEATPTQRGDPTNGLLLSLTHHRMFDLDWLRIDQEYRVQINPGALEGHDLTTTQRQALNAIDGRKIALPEDPKSWPSMDLLAQRYSSAKIRRTAKIETEIPTPAALP